jgi:hypothetical protein
MMYGRFVLASIVFLAALLPCKALLAGSCLVDLEDQAKGAVIQIHGKEQALSTSTRVSDCSQLVLVRGMIHVLYETQNGITRKTCKDLNKPCSVDAGTWPSWLDPATYQVASGGKKMDKDVSRLPGIPHGRVFSIERAATFNLAKAGLTYWNLTLMDAERRTPLYRKSGSDPVLQVPSNLLRPGGKYSLLIDGGNQRYKGGFDILGGTEAEDVSRQIRQVNNDASATARARKLDQLIIFYENNLDYEMELLREDLKL